MNSAITVLEFLSALNDGDAKAACAFVHEDAVFIDGDGETVEGASACSEFIHRLCAISDEFLYDVQSITMQSGDYLIDGHIKADEYDYADRLFAKVRVDAGRLTCFQRFDDMDKRMSLSELLVPHLRSSSAKGRRVSRASMTVS